MKNKSEYMIGYRHARLKRNPIPPITKEYYRGYVDGIYANKVERIIVWAICIGLILIVIFGVK